MQKILTLIFSVLLASCNSSSERNAGLIDSTNFKEKKVIAGWKAMEGRNIKFVFPDNWRVKVRSAQGTTQFGLTFDPDTADIFYPIEIWEFNAGGGTFDDFSSAPHEYFRRMTADKKASLINQTKIQFKSFDAKKFEFNSDNYPVEVTTVNGGKNYYMLVLYKEDKVESIADLIFNSIEINGK